MLKDLTVFNGTWTITRQSQKKSQLVWRNGNDYQIVFTNNIFGKYGQGWVCRSTQRKNNVYEQYFGIKTNGAPWDRDSQIIYANILKDIPSQNVLINQIIYIVFINDINENQYVYNSLINVKIACAYFGDNENLSYDIQQTNLPLGLNLVFNNDGVYLSGVINSNSYQPFNIKLVHSSGASKGFKINLNVIGLVENHGNIKFTGINDSQLFINSDIDFNGLVGEVIIQ